MQKSEKLKIILTELWYKNIRQSAAIGLLFIGRLFFIAKINRMAFRFCSSSLRYQITPGGTRLIKILAKLPLIKSFISKGTTIKGAAQRSIILKWPTFTDTGIEKGILVITFTGTFAFFIEKINTKLLEKYFVFVLEPSWSGYADADILAFCDLDERLIVQCSEIQDRALINQFPDHFVAASFGASDWVNHFEFKPTEAEKCYDAIYIANANPIKRVSRFVQAVSNIVKSGNPQYKACLVCASWGGSKAAIENLVREYNLADNLILKFSLTKTEVIEHLNISKSNILLSYKEGSNRSLFEAMFCNTPVICIYENVGVNKAYINEHTGLLVQDELIEEAMLWISKNHTQFSPRDWAMANISPEATTQKLAKIVKFRLEEKTLEPDMVMVKTNNPEVQYLNWPHLEFYDLNEALFELFSHPVTTPSDIDSQIMTLAETFKKRLSLQPLPTDGK